MTLLLFVASQLFTLLYTCEYIRHIECGELTVKSYTPLNFKMPQIHSKPNYNIFQQLLLCGVPTGIVPNVPLSAFTHLNSEIQMFESMQHHFRFLHVDMHGVCNVCVM